MWSRRRGCINRPPYRFQEYFVQLDSEVDLAELYNIRLISRYNDELQSEEDQYFRDRESIVF